jgi:thiol:disulfide interchange protein
MDQSDLIVLLALCGALMFVIGAWMFLRVFEQAEEDRRWIYICGITVATGLFLGGAALQAYANLHPQTDGPYAWNWALAAYVFAGVTAAATPVAANTQAVGWMRFLWYAE